jgi:hypothetical protein
MTRKEVAINEGTKRHPRTATSRLVPLADYIDTPAVTMDMIAALTGILASPATPVQGV